MRKLIAVAIGSLVVVALAWAGAWTGTVTYCTAPTSCSFSLQGGGAIGTFYDGSAWVQVPGDTQWSVAPTGTMQYQVTVLGPCPPYNCEVIEVTIPQFDNVPLHYFDGTPTGKFLSGNGQVIYYQHTGRNSYRSNYSGGITVSE